MKEKLSQLGVPPAAIQNGGQEILRAFVVNGGLHVSLQRAFDEPDAWGILLADLARHAARIYATDTKLTTDAALTRIRTLFDA